MPSIYAVGDVTGRAALTPVAIREGWYFAETVFNNNPQAVDHSLIPTAVFAEPEIGVIGLTETEAATHGDIDVYVARFRPMINTLSTRTERMILKLITEKDGGKVLGCHILGPGAAEMIQLVAIPMGMGASKADFDRAMAAAPDRRRGTGDLQGARATSTAMARRSAAEPPRLSLPIVLVSSASLGIPPARSSNPA